MYVYMQIINSPLNEGSNTGGYFFVSLQLLRAEYVIERGGRRLNEVGTGGGVVTLDVLLFP